LKFLDTSAPRVPGLDLMRGIAILWVMLFHFRFMITLPHVLYWPARYGWMGVDLFFVLSGYLIGSQLMRPYLRGGTPSLGGFYFRRAFRILPAYLTVLALYFAIPGFREAPGLSPAWQFLTFTENFRINYAVDRAFSHVWSLCVEEHFYLVLPLLILILMRKPRFGKALLLILSILVFGMLVRGYIYLHQLKPLLLAGNDDYYLLYTERIYYPTHTRLDGLLVGVVLACIRIFRHVWWEKMVSRGYLLLTAGLLCCASACWLFRDRFGLYGTLVGFPLMSLGLGLLVASSISPQILGSLERVLPGIWGKQLRSLSTQSFSVMATLAYSLYLTHKEIGHLCRVHLDRYMQSGGWPAFVIAFVVSILAAALLYLAVERPFLRLRERLSARQPRPAAESATAG
jgi:peptidoglycan/LPS O-acetylase OafA/YrhL